MDLKEIKEELGGCDWMRAVLNSYTVDCILWLIDRCSELETANTQMKSDGLKCTCADKSDQPSWFCLVHGEMWQASTKRIEG